jgi:hypothetical protein
MIRSSKQYNGRANGLFACLGVLSLTMIHGGDQTATGDFTITEGANAGTVVTANQGDVAQGNASGFIGAAEADDPGTMEVEGCDSRHFHGTLIVNGNFISDPFPLQCGFGRVAALNDPPDPDGGNGAPDDDADVVQDAEVDPSEIEKVVDLLSVVVLGVSDVQLDFDQGHRSPGDVDDGQALSEPPREAFFFPELSTGFIVRARGQGATAVGDGDTGFIRRAPVIMDATNPDRDRDDVPSSTPQGATQNPVLISALDPDFLALPGVEQAASQKQKALTEAGHETKDQSFFEEFADETRQRANEFRKLADEARKTAENSDSETVKDVFGDTAERHEATADRLEGQAKDLDGFAEKHRESAEKHQRDAKNAQEQIEKAKNDRVEAERQKAEAEARRLAEERSERLAEERQQRGNRRREADRTRFRERQQKLKNARRKAFNDLRNGTTPAGDGTTPAGDEPNLPAIPESQVLDIGLAVAEGVVERRAGQAAGSILTLLKALTDFFTIRDVGEALQETAGRVKAINDNASDQVDEFLNNPSKGDIDAVRDSFRNPFVREAKRGIGSVFGF